MQEDPRTDREWENWPGRRTSDDGIRHRLRALFAATDDEEAIEALIVQRGREIEEQTDQLQATIADLERREEQTGRLRSAVEEMLRHGSAELDERHAELAALALELRARDEKVRADERDIAVRKQELGAVELRRAAVERREEAAAEREAVLERISDELTSRELEIAEAKRRLDEHETSVLDRQADPATRSAALPPGQPTSPADEASHILYVTGDTYRFVEHDGPAPSIGTSVDVDGRSFVVMRVGRSPLPGDGRPCAYLERAADSTS